MEAIVVLSRRLQPSATTMWFVSDNARTLRNEFIPLIALFIFRRHGFKIQRFLQPDTARGKSLVDAYFDIAMKKASELPR